MREKKREREIEREERETEIHKENMIFLPGKSCISNQSQTLFLFQ